MKVAFATKSKDSVDAHFGWAPFIVLYNVEKDSHEFLEEISFEKDLKEDGDEDKLEPKVKAIEGCAMLYVSAIGGSAAAKVVAKKVHPVKVDVNEPISALIEKTQEIMKGPPPPWLRKVMRTDTDFDLEEEYDN